MIGGRYICAVAVRGIIVYTESCSERGDDDEEGI